MKIRNGFVSNSSSSSFVCCVCDEILSGWDASPSDLGMKMCVNGHTFCECHMENIPKPTPDKLRESIRNAITLNCYINESKRNKELEELNSIPDNELDEYEEQYIDRYSGEFDVLDYKCPICIFEKISNSDCTYFLIRKCSTSMDEIRKEIKSSFKSYKDFSNYLKNKK